MTLGVFLDAAYALIVDETARLRGDLQTALHDAEQWRAGGPSEMPSPGEAPTPSQEADIAQQNAQALAELQKAMASTGMAMTIA